MSYITIRTTPAESAVWIHLERGTPEWQHQSFVIGLGPTKSAAIEQAIEDLKSAIEELRLLHD